MRWPWCTIVRNKKLVSALASLAVIHLVAVFAGFLAPYSYREQNRDAPSAAPTKVRWIDREGRLHLRPFIYAGTDGDVVPVRFWVRGSSYELLGLVPTDLHLFGVEDPHRIFLLGTDSLGRDYFSRLLYGGQVSLTAGLLAAALALAIALVLGATAGYCGRLADLGIMWAGDVFLSLPWLYMVLAARAFLPLDLDPEDAFFVIILLLGLLGWAAPMRLVRGMVMGAKQREFVTAARSAGAGHAHVIARHVLPQTYRVLATQAAVLIPAYMLAEVTLSFVGLGVGEPRPSWGNMLAEVPRTSLVSAEPWTFAPAVMLVLVTWLYHSVLSTGPSRGEDPKLPGA